MRLLICISSQTLELLGDDGTCVRRYRVSTASNGPGEQSGSECTPRGRHIVRAKIGAGQSIGAVFKARRPTGEIWTADLAVEHPGRDWILTRILWLSGCQPGFNRLGAVDTMRRYIYIHGTPDVSSLGQQASHGCIRMADADVAELFELIQPGCPVDIIE